MNSLIYILAGKKNKTVVGIADNERIFLSDQLSEHLPDKKYETVKLIYFEKIDNRAKALRRKRYLSYLSEKGRLRIVRKYNPELLNLIFDLNQSNKIY